MFVYNISIKINKEISLQWSQWQREEHIPDVMQTGLFVETKFLNCLNLVTKRHQHLLSNILLIQDKIIISTLRNFPT
jgi:hypothetical protein